MKPYPISRPWTIAAMTLALALAGCGQAAPESGASGAPTSASGQPAPAATTADAPATAATTADATASSANATTAPASGAQTNQENAMTTASGLSYTEVSAGTGAVPKPGDLVTVHYTGTLENGTVFDSSYSRDKPIQFAIGTGMVIPGWDEGIALMKEGGKAKLVIPPNLAYGEKGAGGVIPPNATLNFDVFLVSVRPGAPKEPTKVEESKYTTTPSGLKYFDLQPGSGALPQAGQQVTVHYTGWLTDGTSFDSSLNRGEPFVFALGQGQVIPGWDEGVASMKIGGKRQLVIPAKLGYGEKGAGGVIPPNATLIFEVELLDAK